MTTKMPASPEHAKSVEQVSALFKPRTIAIIGASDRPQNYALRVFRNLKRYGFTGAIYPVNPARTEVWDMPCYPDLRSLPQAPDQVLILVPAAKVCQALEEAAQCGARSATIFSSGFEETQTAEGRILADELRSRILETGLAVSGPNCLGNFAAPCRLMTMPDDRAHRQDGGPVAIVSQSGGIVTAIKRMLNDRGIEAGYMVTTGNESGLTSADFIHFFAVQPEIKVIVCYLEAIRSPEAFLSACRVARAENKVVIVVKLGGSEVGRAAAQAHTGALAGANEAFDAVAGAAGAIRVADFGDAAELAEFFLHSRLPKGKGLGVLSLSGGLRGLVLDSASAMGLPLPQLAPATIAQLQQLLGVGTIIGNPLDAGFSAVTNHQIYRDTIAIMLDDPSIDLLIIQEELPRAPGHVFKETALRMVNSIFAEDHRPIAYFSIVPYGLDDYARELRRELPHLAFLQEIGKTLRTVGYVHKYIEEKARLATEHSMIEATADSSLIRTDMGARVRQKVLDEVQSKEILREFGIPVQPEKVVRTAEEAAIAARELGFPVVMKVVSSQIPHKSDNGCVQLDIGTADDAMSSFRRIYANALKCVKGDEIEGVLVAPFLTNGLELAMGIKHDSDMGCVVMFGMGGVWLELFADVAFCAPDIDRERALSLIGKTRASHLIEGYRRGLPFDEEAVISSLIGLGRFARKFGHLIEAVDINPFIALDRGKGGFAVDALIVLR
jgi:acetyltransferase